MSKNRQYWLAIRTMPHKELLVLGELEIREFEVFLPMIVKVYLRGVKRTRPLISGYVMVLAGEADCERLRYIPGSKGLLMIESKPAIVTEKEIELLRLMIGEGDFDPQVGNFCKGDKVRVLTGPFMGCIGFVCKSEKNRIGIDLIGSIFRVWVKLDQTMFEKIL
jgi:transcription antitermination factor NusG